MVTSQVTGIVLRLGIVALVLLPAVACGDRGDGGETGDGVLLAEQPPYSGPLPSVGMPSAEPPALVGSVAGDVGTNCEDDADCVGGWPATLDLADRAAAPDQQQPVADIELADGRVFEATPTGGAAPWGERGMPEWWLVDPERSSRVSIGAGFLEDAAALGDGRIAAVWTPLTTDGTPEVRLLDTDATSRAVATPDGFIPRQVADGPHGWYAVLGGPMDDVPCCGQRLLLVGPQGVHQRMLVLPDRSPSGSPVEVAWGPSGLIAVATRFPAHPDEPDDDDYTMVLDPRAGTLVASFDGWLGTAWSPDGTGLLLARLTGSGGAQLALVWGEDLAERTDLGTIPAAFTPHRWVQSR
jgi:hypothetical protein